MLILAVGFVGATYAGQNEADNLNVAKGMAENRVAEDRQFRGNPATRVNKIGWKTGSIYNHPNNDGWGETGWQGGG